MSSVPWPKRSAPGSNANYWQLDYDTIANMQWTVTPTSASIPLFTEPHACVIGTVENVMPKEPPSGSRTRRAPPHKKKHASMSVQPRAIKS